MINKLEATGSITIKSKLLRMKMIVKDITVNRDRIQEIFTSLNEPQDPKRALKVLFMKNLLSDEQYNILLNNEFNLEDVKRMLTRTKYGRGIMFYRGDQIN